MSSQEKRTSIDILSSQPTGILVLENGTSFFGYGIGHKGSAVGEVCFNTSITGYQEIITDPSYSDQIINFTFPHIGNVGTNLEDIESEKIWLKGVIFAKEITEPSNYRSLEKLNQWLTKNKIVGLVGIDSRKLTNLIRNNGALKATIVNEKNNLDEKTYLDKCQNWPGLKGMELTEKVTTKKIYQWSDESLWDKKNGYNKNKEYKYNIVVLDFGVKKNILRNFSNLKAKVTVVPSTTEYKTIKDLNPDGIFLSNGPGDPAATFEIVKNTYQIS